MVTSPTRVSRRPLPGGLSLAWRYALSCCVLAGPRRNGVSTWRSAVGSKPRSAGSAPRNSASSAPSYPAGESSGSVTHTQSAPSHVCVSYVTSPWPPKGIARGVPLSFESIGSCSFVSTMSPTAGSNRLVGTTGRDPPLMACADRTIPLCSACLNTSRSCTAGTAPDARTSPRTEPGPTLGSWSASPTKTICASGLMASRSAAHRGRSSMDDSSTTTTSASSGELLFLAKSPL